MGAAALPARSAARGWFPPPAVHSVARELVRTLQDGRLEAGVHEISWDGRDGAGRDVPPGAYVCTLVANDFEQSRRVLVAR